MRIFFDLLPGVSLRSAPGYFLQPSGLNQSRRVPKQPKILEKTYCGVSDMDHKLENASRRRHCLLPLPARDERGEGCGGQRAHTLVTL